MVFGSNDWNKYFDYLSKWEGGKSANASDTASTQVKSGQIHTNRGITWATWQYYAPKLNINPDRDNFEAMDRKTASNIAFLYFGDSGASLLKNTNISLLFFEIAWGSGKSYAVSHLRAALNNLGLIKKTDKLSFSQLAKIANSANQKNLYNELLKVRTGFYKQIVINNPSQKVFLQGWLNRLADFKNNFGVAAAGGSVLLVGTLFFLIYKIYNK